EDGLDAGEEPQPGAPPPRHVQHRPASGAPAAVPHVCSEATACVSVLTIWGWGAGALTCSASATMRSGEPSATSSFLAWARSRKCFLSCTSTSCGTFQYASACCATRAKTGADTSPPSCSPTGESRTTSTVSAGLFTGAKPVNDAM